MQRESESEDQCVTPILQFEQECTRICWVSCCGFGGSEGVRNVCVRRVVDMCDIVSQRKFFDVVIISRSEIK